MASFISVVICHGSWHTPEPYQPFIDALKQENIEAFCPQLPTADLTKLNVGDISHPDFDRDPPPGGYPQQADDVKVVDEILRNLIVEQGKHVIVMGHSSGGFVAAACAIPELQAKNRTSGGIIGIFQMCAILVPAGDSTSSYLAPKDGPPRKVPFVQFHKNGPDGLMTTIDGAKYFYNGLDEEKAKYYESKCTAVPMGRTVLENDVYSALPMTYLLCENDLAIPPPVQEAMVSLHNQRPEVDIKVVRCPSGHSPFLTWIDGLVAEVTQFAKGLLA